ncbi:hypothetical protein AVEN_4001-1 [Araneus ventricosus]|uniref:Uncharacterized protein n=1 Tax=Araneus ventricosus TaxID=182803 RepID=A0A4Y2H440_ARAVE|nr:hypothetical protein AVEN_4001-1 [Araneus ventricosus]
MISAVRKRTLSNNSNIDFEKLSEVVMQDMGPKPEKYSIPVIVQPKSSRIGLKYLVSHFYNYPDWSWLHIYKPYPDRTEAGNQPIPLATRAGDVTPSSRTKRTAIIT